ncbi:phosphate/phosphite/phosphonate ABC transporter substrate-binding protein [Corynebacterium pseudopelargi]|uniref:Phosphate-import protein PhnD n=1 Tax=Corynebacterium pseudopelargi TaxID=2080757 RepID=A0A3G6IW28_9CORY|nr:phosphate/phosphite/phosphonate ABC transporter substrate-binding protein [Corynebacterium pseudopelargi]AZA09981.1 Phosphate-import protein PhnD precursor [Corynebacterium pseudopelargi]
MTTLLQSTKRATTATVASIAALGLFAGLSACSSDGSDSEKSVTFAAVPAESSQTLESTYSNLAKLIEQEAGVKVKFQNAADYAAVIEGQRAGQIDIASYGPFSYVIAKDSGVDIEPVAAPTNNKDEAPAYRSVAYVKKGSEIKDLKDVKGKKVCFVDAASTSGYLVPSEGLLSEGIDPKDDVEPVMAGGHDASLLGLDSGQCDVAFAHDSMLKTLEKSGQIKPDSVQDIWTSNPIPEDPIVLNTSTLDPEVADKIRDAIQTKANKPELVKAGICSSEQDCVLPEEIEYGYLPVTDADYNSIRKICEVTKADACKNVG